MILGLDRDAPRSERFEILSRLGAGGMGVVYLALDRKRNVKVALKSLPMLDGDRLVSFKREFRALQDVQHPNLVGLGELFEEGGRWFFTLELVEGIDLLSYVRPERSERDLTAPTTPVEQVPTVLYTAPTLTSFSRAELRVVPEDDGPPPSAQFDLARLRSAFSQLAEALIALHDAGKVHRDVKPANALVTAEGRVVLLDFGLVLDIEDAPSESHVTAGTLAYMAPEQTSSRALKPSADWYSFGVVLYQALTGVLPFRGSPLQVMMAKVRSPPPPPRSLLPEIPADLDEVCAKLLALDPQSRPSAEEVLRVLSASSEGGARTVAPPRASRSTFVGRSTELAALRTALADSRRGTPVFVSVIGESGLGKSALARRFGEIASEEERALVLAGRCYERESIRYKAFDGIIDAIAAHLRRLGESVSRILPEGTKALAHVFPVLERVKAIAREPRTPVVVDPLELRVIAFRVLRELLSRLAADRPLILYIDDLQWADEDSLTLLSEVLRPPGAPLLLVLATLRPGWESHLERFVEPRKIELTPLSLEMSEELALELLAESSPEAREGAKALASDAAGHPLFIQELVRAMLDLGPEKARGLEEVMKARIARLDPDARLLLELVSVAGAPIAEDALARAAGQEAVTFDRAMASVRTRTFVRVSSAQEDRSVEPYHDRVREAAVLGLAEAELGDRHRRIAEALESLGRKDLERLALHWRGAGEKAKAARYAAQGAAKAMESLAFHHAARLYRWSLELRAEVDPERRSLEIALGDALVAAGQPGAASDAYLRAALGAPRAESIELRRRAAEQRIRMGQVEEGVAIAAEVMKDLGMSIPGPREALALLLMNRMKIRLRGYEFVERKPSEIPPDLLAKCDMTCTFATSLALMNPLLGMYFQSCHTLSALEAGDPIRIARALPFEVAWVSVSGFDSAPRVLEIAERARALAERLDHPYAIAMADMGAGVANTAWGKWKTAREHLMRARQILHDRCTSVVWEIYTVEAYIMRSSVYLGDIVTVTERLREIVRSAEQGGHAFMLIAQRSAGGMMASLGADDPASGRKIVAEVLRNLPREHGPVPKYVEWLTSTQADLYEGAFAAAHARAVRTWPELEKSRVFTSEEVAIEATDLRARVFGGAAAIAKDRHEREKLMRTILHDARVLERRRAGWARAFAAHHRAAVAALEGAEVIGAIGRAIELFEEANMRLHAASLRWRRGERLGGPEGAAEIAASEAAIRAFGPKNPRGFLRMITPAFEI
jgi:eukaryotic-like serine/threonine-protein kinase